MDDLMKEFMSGGSGGKSALGSLGLNESIDGTIIGEITKRPDLDENGVQKVFKKSGDPKWIYILPIQTDLREDEDDDGKRSLWLSWKSKDAFVQAVHEGWVKAGRTGDPRPEVGGYIIMTCIRVTKTGYGSSVTKDWAAVYLPPEPFGNRDIMTPDPTSGAPATTSVPQSPAAATPYPDKPTASSTLTGVAQAQGNMLQQMKERAASMAAMRAAGLNPTEVTPAHHAVGEPPF